jgi:hypothetical protein
MQPEQENGSGRPWHGSCTESTEIKQEKSTKDGVGHPPSMKTVMQSLSASLVHYMLSTHLQAFGYGMPGFALL